MFKLIFSLVLLGMVSSCMSVAPQTGPDFPSARVGNIPSNAAVIYVFRKYAEPYAFDPVVHVDGKKLKALPNGGFSFTTVNAGAHQIKAVWPFMSGQRDAEVNIEVTAGEEYFVELTGVSTSSGVNTVIIGSGANLLEKAAGQEKISACCKLVQ